MTYRSVPVSTLFFIVILTACSMDQPAQHPFEAYLAEPHPAYSYELRSTIESDSSTTYVFRMVSQEWLTEELVNEPEWWHWLTIVVPDEVEHSAGMLMIGGGTSEDEMPTEAHPIIKEAAVATKSITAHLHNVPFQPVSFSNDRLEERYEDDIIAYGWKKFMESGASDSETYWLSRFPMTTAAMRAMDTVSDFTESTLELTVDKFVLTGASKRGWTTWTTAIFDNRVIAIAPAVIDLLNMVPSFEHHWQAYGEWSPAIREYEDERIMDWQNSLEYQRLTELVDPYSYLDSLSLPKYLINAASDEFFLPDSWQFYWEDLPGEKYLRYIPNTGHSLSGTDMHEGLISFYIHILRNQDLPRFEWEVTGNSIEVRYDPANPPDRLRLWNAHNPEGRDFRLYVIDRIWMARNLTIENDGDVNISIEPPGEGYTAWFVEADFNTESGYPFKQTSGVIVTPDTYPFEPYESDSPLGTMPDNTVASE